MPIGFPRGTLQRAARPEERPEVQEAGNGPSPVDRWENDIQTGQFARAYGGLSHADIMRHDKSNKIRSGFNIGNISVVHLVRVNHRARYVTEDLHSFRRYTYIRPVDRTNQDACRVQSKRAGVAGFELATGPALSVEFVQEIGA